MMVVLILKMNKANYVFSANSLFLHLLLFHSSSTQTRTARAPFGRGLHQFNPPRIEVGQRERVAEGIKNNVLIG